MSADRAEADAPARSAVPALKPHFRFQWEPAQESYVLLYPEGMIKLNGSAGEIMACVDGERSIDTIIATLKAKFAEAGGHAGGLPDDMAAGMTRDILEFFDAAHDNRWIDLN